MSNTKYIKKSSSVITEGVPTIISEDSAQTDSTEGVQGSGSGSGSGVNEIIDVSKLTIISEGFGAGGRYYFAVLK
jgi:hypothetical protein